MDHVTLTYKGLIIGRLNSACSLSLKTAGKYCEADIELSYVVRCPHGDAVAVLEMDDFFAAFVPKGFIRETEVTEQEE